MGDIVHVLVVLLLAFVLSNFHQWQCLACAAGSPAWLLECICLQQRSGPRLHDIDIIMCLQKWLVLKYAQSARGGGLSIVVYVKIMSYSVISRFKSVDGMTLWKAP
jgi:hypothetical protein